ncbi:MAG: peptide deformylase [Francisellaceae bacterium]|nr:peptide deformylase [Francisellaceae bacterium]
MTLLHVLHFPDNRLKLKAMPVSTVDKEILTLIDNMFETMYEEEGVGLAAIQVNVPKSVITIDCSSDKSQALALINPHILEQKGSVQSEEGCLSFRGVYDKVTRFETIKVQYLNVHSELQTLEASGLLSICIQHEIDHLNGITFYDHLSALKKERIRKKLQKMRRRDL